MIRKIVTVKQMALTLVSAVYILQLAVHTVQRNWVSSLGRYLVLLPDRANRLYRPAINFCLGEPGSREGLCSTGLSRLVFLL